MMMVFETFLLYLIAFEFVSISSLCVCVRLFSVVFMTSGRRARGFEALKLKPQNWTTWTEKFWLDNTYHKQNIACETHFESNYKRGYKKCQR